MIAGLYGENLDKPLERAKAESDFRPSVFVDFWIECTVLVDKLFFSLSTAESARFMFFSQVGMWIRLATKLRVIWFSGIKILPDIIRIFDTRRKNVFYFFIFFKSDRSQNQC